ncbi:hypothetical protein Kpol_534p21 [Vanderwaltozyma polyspora DSM 70294]|uniref:Uncharacterized protein n=1 Tax=Vanderwaltozyma polyspora (strain ATCC 22028 / DSM 70294 / BCRC 21397 / CBS 2163 / NBRC 10782 / NRRL Y-8283 / UCD 57-17) TaxID=436907 RepID=A7TJJ9_VANPO|nr:uncharacterized protein Kpol_534p21 [Vanderwaltozyma polyspora DSM 70294]EDO17542.1 hypothetical protein Kpol_534p21 [Vanderwaltozyma polyspora DSM 70294]
MTEEDCLISKFKSINLLDLSQIDLDLIDDIVIQNSITLNNNESIHLDNLKNLTIEINTLISNLNDLSYSNKKYDFAISQLEILKNYHHCIYSNILKDLNSARDYIILTTGNGSNLSLLLNDSITLLLEFWKILTKKINYLNLIIISYFIYYKLLIINYELTQLNNHILSILNLPNFDNFDNVYSSLQKILNLLNSFKVLTNDLIENLITYLFETNFNKINETLSETLSSFINLNDLYNLSNFNLLLLEIQSITDVDSKSSSSTENHNGDESEMDHSLQLISSMQSSTPTTSVYDDHLFDSSLRRLSISEFTDVSSLPPTNLGRTTLQRELPNLLAAFNVTKRLENELENVLNAKANVDSNSNSNTSSSSSPQPENLNPNATGRIPMGALSPLFNQSMFNQYSNMNKRHNQIYNNSMKLKKTTLNLPKDD